MKLRNKKTGEIKDWSFAMLQNIGQTTEWKHYGSLTELNAEWEDYEEPKTFWAISWAGEPEEYDAKNAPQELKDMARSIGNCFESKEDAEKAVEKLKAWQRLKDNGFKVDLWDYDGGNVQEKIRTGRILFRVADDYPEKNIDEDLDLLFGGEE